MSPAEKEAFEIEIAVAYTLGEAVQRVGRGAINVRDSVVVIDTLTNDIRGTRLRPPLSTDDFINGIDRLRLTLKTAGAKSIIVCQVKPMTMKDVRPYNDSLSVYLRGRRWGPYFWGLPTQIKHNHLKPDGFHVKRQFHWLVCETYARAVESACTPQNDE